VTGVFCRGRFVVRFDPHNQQVARNKKKYFFCPLRGLGVGSI
jgi:hypothetical protein